MKEDASGRIGPPFLDSALDGGDWSASRPGHFTPGDIVPGTYWIEGWVVPRDGLDDMEKRKLLTLPGLEFRSLAGSADRRYTDCAIPALYL
jgi:hypothetical protein